jgi:AcrR family transcriptional regulator
VATRADEPTAGLRQRKKATTRAKLLDAALGLISQHGYEATSIEDIVSFVGVSKRTFFRYFGSKDDVLVAWIGEFGEHVRVSLASRPKSEKPLLALQTALISSVKSYESQYFFSIPLERAINSNSSIQGRKLVKLQLCAESVSHALANRMKTSNATDLIPSVLAHCAMAVLLGSSYTWYGNGCKGKLSTVVMRAFRQMRIDIGCVTN